MSIQPILDIIFSPNNGMRRNKAMVMNIQDTDWNWLYLTGGAHRSMMQYLRENYPGKFTELKDPTQAKGKTFCILQEPKERWYKGIIEWSTCFGEYEWWKNDRIMEWFPHFDRFTLRYSEQIDQIPTIDKIFKLDKDFENKITDFIKDQKLKIELDFPHVKSRYRTVKWVRTVYNFVQPKFKKFVGNNPELQKKLDEYLAPDYVYYEKAK